MPMSKMLWWGQLVTSPLWAWGTVLRASIRDAEHTQIDIKQAFYSKRVSGIRLPIVAMSSPSYNQPYGVPLFPSQYIQERWNESTKNRVHALRASISPPLLRSLRLNRPLPMISRRDYPLTSPSKAFGLLVIVTSLIGSTALPTLVVCLF